MLATRTGLRTLGLVLGLAALWPALGCVRANSGDMEASPTPTYPAAACVDLEAVTPSCELGTGSSSFETLTDGQEVPMIFGPQGGYHVWGAVRMHGVYAGDLSSEGPWGWPVIGFTLDGPDGSLGGKEPLPRRVTQLPNGDLEISGETVFLNTLAVDALVGVEARLTVQITDRCGAQVADQRRVVLRRDN